MNRYNRFGVLAVVALMSVPAVANAVAARVPSTFSPQVPSDSSRVVIDGVGRRVTIPARVDRVVSLAPNLTETLYALGLGGRLVGDTTYCDVPAAAKEKPHVGAPINPSVEAIVGLRPDLVLASATINRPETVDALDHVGIPVYTADSHTVRSMIDSVGRIASVVGAAKQGQSLTKDLTSRLETLHSQLMHDAPVRVVFVVWIDPLQSVGQNTFIADALRWAGAESVVASNQNWPLLSFEEVVRLQPDYLVFAASHAGEASVTLQDLRNRPVWQDLRAVKDGHVAIVSDEIDRPDPGLIRAIEQLAKDLHPDAFKSEAAGGTDNRSAT